MPESQLSGVILAGGENRRMGGQDKAFIKIKGREIIERTLDLFKEIFAEVLIITNSPADYRKFDNDALLVSDVFKNIGPLGGIYAGLVHISKEAGFFAACDMPLLERDLIEEQIKLYKEKDCPCLVARCAGRLEPLHAIYSKKITKTVKSSIEAEKFSIRDVINHLEGREFFEVGEEKKSSFFNLNTPLDSVSTDYTFGARKISGATVRNL
jgi:molybdopterin-guanine dinucleotide biosynthesis protein A